MLYDPKNDLPEYKKILLRAHELLENGWCRSYLKSTKNHLGEKVDSFCLEGAISFAAHGICHHVTEVIDGRVVPAHFPGCVGDPFEVAPAYLKACMALHQVIRPGTNLWSWNDAPQRTKDEVLAKLREAIAADVLV